MPALPCCRALILALLVFLPSAGAQTLLGSVGVGVNGRAQPALRVGLTLRNVALIGGYGVAARVQTDLGPGGGLEVGGLAEVPFDLASQHLSVYGGPGVALRFGSTFRLRPSVITGVAYDLNGQLGLYVEGSYQFQGEYRVGAGVTYSF